MRLVTYTPERFDAWQRAAGRMGAASLCHRPFVDYYYASRDGCRLTLFLDENDEVAGVIGVDKVRFEYDGAPLELGFSSNYYALQKGAGGLLFMQWMKSCAIGVVFGGGPMTHQIIESQKWSYFAGVKTYFLNRAYQPSPRDRLWRRAAKLALRGATRPMHISRRAARLPAPVLARLAVHEESALGADMLPRTSPFKFRCAADVEYLNWRYNTRLSFVRYRVFRLTNEGQTTGYVILSEAPERVTVAQCDGENAEDLAYGILLSLAAVAANDRRPREVMLTSCHPAMRAIFEAFGFKTTGKDRPLAFGALRRPIPFEPDTAHWLVNFDWTDNGLRAPFLDQH